MRTRDQEVAVASVESGCVQFNPANGSGVEIEIATAVEGGVRKGDGQEEEEGREAEVLTGEPRPRGRLRDRDREVERARRVRGRSLLLLLLLLADRLSVLGWTSLR